MISFDQALRLAGLRPREIVALAPLVVAVAHFAHSRKGIGLGGPNDTAAKAASSLLCGFSLSGPAQWRSRWGAARLAGFRSAVSPVRQPAGTAAILAGGGSRQPTDTTEANMANSRRNGAAAPSSPRCRVGDLCFVIRSTFPENIGRVVKVVQRAPTGVDRPDDGHVWWEVETAGSLLRGVAPDNTEHMASRAAGRDSWLLPIRPQKKASRTTTKVAGHA